MWDFVVESILFMHLQVAANKRKRQLSFKSWDKCGSVTSAIFVNYFQNMPSWPLKIPFSLINKHEKHCFFPCRHHCFCRESCFIWKVCEVRKLGRNKHKKHKSQKIKQSKSACNIHCNLKNNPASDHYF